MDKQQGPTVQYRTRNYIQYPVIGTSLVVQWLRLRLPMQGGAGSIPGWGAKIPQASGPKNQNIKQKQYGNKFNKDFKNGPPQKNLKKKLSCDKP